jgi:addiction module RelE/StbE family toxin
MLIQRTVKFKKQYQKLPVKFQYQFDERLRVFVQYPLDVRLRIHPLKGKYAGYWSMDVNGDMRALFRRDGDRIIIFGFIGTHSQLYG